MKKLFALPVLALMAACTQTQTASTEDTSDSLLVITPSLEKIWATDTLVKTSESVFYDKGKNVLYVTCINGVPPSAQDEDGFIAKVNPTDGSIIEEQWITGIDAPKGMGLVGTKLYVSNIDEVVVVDTEKGEILERIVVPGSEFLNDITTDATGNVYVSDSNTNKIFIITPEGELSTWLETEQLGNPNGLLFDGDRIMLATFGRGDFNSISFEDKRITLVADSIPGGDGVVKTGEDFIVSNWNGEVYYVTAGGVTTKMLDTKEMGVNSADIEFDAATSTLFVPSFFGNQVVAYKLTK